MDKTTLLAAADFTRARLLGSLDTIEKSGQDVAKVLAWRPGAGRAHVAWQAMHCAATHDKYINVYARGGQVKDAALVQNFGGGSTPSDTNVPTLPAIRQTLEVHFAGFKDFINALSPGDAAKMIVTGGGKQRSLGESVILLTWHEAHHQGQIHITWNMYKAANGMA